MATRRSQARRFQTARRSTRRSLRSARRSTRRSLQTNPLVGWLAAGALLVALAFVVGGPAAEQGLLGSRSSPTPSASAALPIRFGLALDPDSNRAVRPVRAHRAGQTFAYSVTLTQPPIGSSIFVEVERISGTPRVVQERSIQHITAGTPDLCLHGPDRRPAGRVGRRAVRDADLPGPAERADRDRALQAGRR